MADPIPKYPLYDSTYTAYRLSPLYHGANTLLDETTLRMHARRLRDTLRGDILRGVDVGAGSFDGTSAILESCTWDLIGDEESWETLHRQDIDAQEDEQPGDLTDAPSLDPSEARGVHVELRYQKASYTALLLRDPEADDVQTPEGFTALPLLFVRMPVALRDTFTSYIASTFDARIAPMKLRSRFLSATLETILSHPEVATTGSLSSASPLPSILSRLQLQISFPTACPTATLRALDITLSRNDVPDFLTRGIALLPNTAADDTNITGPFTAALSHYLQTHLALSLAHPGVHISKIALPPLLALSAGDGARIKLFSPHTAASAAPDSASVSVAALQRVMDAFYRGLLRAAHAAPVAEGMGAGAGAEKAVLVLRKGKGKEKPAAAEKAATMSSASSKKGKKRALGEGDANVVVDGGGGGGRGGGRKKAEASPGKKRRRQQQRGRVGGDAAAGEEGEEQEGDVEGGGGEEEEDAVGSSSAPRRRAAAATAATRGGSTAAASSAGRSSVPQEPPPPYELHDPAIVR